MLKQGNTILITGGGSGIGRRLAERWNELGNKVIVVGRRADALQETIKGRSGMHFYVMDVGNPNSIESVSKQILQDHPDLNVLVNNAGCAASGEDVTKKRNLEEETEVMINVNFVGLIRVTNAFIEHFQQIKNSTIINVSSGTGFVPYVFAPTYSATKAAVHSFTISLRANLKKKNVEVIEIIPPQVATDLTKYTKDSPGSMPLNAFVDEVLDLLDQKPGLDEIIVECVKPFRYAEREGKTEEFVASMIT